MKLNRNPLLALLAASAVLLAGCGTHATGAPPIQRQAASLSAAAVNAAALQALQSEQKGHHDPRQPLVFTTFTNLEVKTLLPDDTDGLPHQQFNVEISGETVRVAHDTALAPHVPLKVGDHVDIKGVYLPGPHVLHWTHYSPEGGEGGYIKLNGKVYDRL